MKFAAMVKIEPGLRGIEQFVASAHRSGMAWSEFTTKLNDLLKPLVGLGAAEATLRSISADRDARKYLQDVRISGTAQDERRRAKRWKNASLPWTTDDAAERANPSAPTPSTTIPPKSFIDFRKWKNRESKTSRCR